MRGWAVRWACLIRHRIEDGERQEPGQEMDMGDRIIRTCVGDEWKGFGGAAGLGEEDDLG